MGHRISSLQEQLQENEAKLKREEQLNILEMMLKAHLDNAKERILNGELNDEEIHGGEVVEYIQQSHATITSKPNPDLLTSIQDFFSGNLLTGFAKIIKVGVDEVLGNSSIGQFEGTSMFIMWTNNALLRLDGYYFRWNFSSKEAITDTEGVSGVLTIKRVIDVTKTNPQVLTWAITRQAKAAGKGSDASKMIDDAVNTLKKVTALEQAVHDIQAKESSEGIGNDSRN